MDIKLPELGENIAQGTVSKVLVKVGDSVKKGQNIIELETDKAVLEVPSPAEGTVQEVLIKNGQTIKVGQPVFKFSGGTSATVPTAGKTASAAPAPVKPSTAAVPQPAPIPVANGAVIDLKLPGLGENITQGTVTKVLVKKGDFINKGQNIIELETDKAVLEVPSPMEGVVEDVLIKSGQIVKVGHPAFTIRSTSQASSSPTTAPKTGPTVPLAAPIKAETKAVAAKPSAFPAQATVAEPAKNVAAAPSVRRFAREIGVDIAAVAGTGPGGRISIEDVKAHAKRILTSGGMTGSLSAHIPLPDFSKWGSIDRQSMNNVRKKTAEHLTHAWQTIPHVTQFDKADITELEKLRKRLSTKEKKMSITPFIIKVISAALKNFPQFNAAVDMSTNEIIYKKYVNIGVAVDTDRGLLVPVLKNVDRMTIAQISDELTAIAERARNRKTTLEEMQGGCFTISNLGGIGGTFFTPIVNWPEVAILGVSRGVMEQVYSDNHFTPRLMLPLSLSYDHRLIDGADGARFMRWVCDAIQQPFLMDINN